MQLGLLLNYTDSKTEASLIQQDVYTDFGFCSASLYFWEPVRIAGSGFL